MCRTVSWPCAVTSESLLITAVTAPGQEIFPAVTQYKTTTCQFKTLICVQIKQTYDVLISELYA